MKRPKSRSFALFVGAGAVLTALATGCAGSSPASAEPDGSAPSSGEKGGAGTSGDGGGTGSGGGGATSSAGAPAGAAGQRAGSGGSHGSGGKSGSGGASSGSGGSGAGGAAPGTGGASVAGATSAGGAMTGAGGATGNPAGLWTIVNHPCYQWGELPASSVPWSHISHLIIGYLWPKSSGTGYTLDVQPGVCRDLDAFKSQAAAYVDAGHKAGKKVSLQLGGAGSNPNKIWNTATNAGNVGGFAENIVTVVKGMGLDGVDLDWEDDLDTTQVIALARELRSRWSDGVITLPTGPTGADAKDLAGAKDFVDAFEPMTYMVVEQWGGWHIPVPLTPLFAYQSNPYSVDMVRKSWIAAGVPSSKLIMGIGGYGTAWTDTNGDGRAPVAPYTNTDQNGPADSETAPSMSDNAVTQKWLDKTLAAHKDLVEGWDDVGKCSYWHAPGAGQLVSVEAPSGGTVKVGSIFFESPRSMAEKAQYVKTNGMKGFMFWTLAELVNGTSSPVLEAL